MKIRLLCNVGQAKKGECVDALEICDDGPHRMRFIINEDPHYVHDGFYTVIEEGSRTEGLESSFIFVLFGILLFAISNFAYQACGGQDWLRAAERTYFQAFAVIMYWAFAVRGK